MPITKSLTAAISDGVGLTQFRNRIINGDMRIDQRNAGNAQSVTSGSTVYTLDRWIVYSAGGTTTSQRVGSIGSYSLQLTGSANVSAFQIIQRIESVNIADLAGQTVTLSFALSSTSLSTVSFYYQTPTTTDNYTSANAPVLIGSPVITSTPTRFSYTFTLPSSATNGVQIFIQSAAFPTGTFSYTNVQLEAGTAATTFERRPFGMELSLCQRYYAKSYNLNEVPGTTFPFGQAGFGIGSGNGYSSGYATVKFPVSMRSSPSMTYYDGTGTAGRYNYYNNTSWLTGAITTDTVMKNDSAIVQLSGSIYYGAFHWVASAEL